MIKCSECKDAHFKDMNGCPGRWYCEYPNVREYVSCPADTLICKTERHKKNMTIKTSPRWCPRRKENGR